MYTKSVVGRCQIKEKNNAGKKHEALVASGRTPFPFVRKCTFNSFLTRLKNAIMRTEKIVFACVAAERSCQMMAELQFYTLQNLHCSKTWRDAILSHTQYVTAVRNVPNEGSDATLLLAATLCNIGEHVTVEDDCLAGRGSVTRRPDSNLGV